MFLGSRNNSSSSLGGAGGSLTVNYVPSKFATGLLSPGARRRKRKGAFDTGLPKQGGGVEAFKSGEARLPGEVDEDYDGVDAGSGWFGAKKQKKLRWNKFKWWLFIANTCLTLWTLIGLIICLLTWFKVWDQSDIILVGNTTELILCTLVSSLGVLNALIGWAGILLNNRAFLAWWSFLNWIVFALLLAPGYLTFRRRRLNLEGKINQEWSQFLSPAGRLRIQDQLGCCGFFSPFVGATMSQTCYSRSVLPGCKLQYLQFQRMALSRFYAAAFSVVPLQMAIMLVGLLCSNHVTYRFGKGMMPPAYRLSMNSMAVIMENYANQLAEQYGSDVATDMLAKSRSNISLNHNDGLQSPTSAVPLQTTMHNHRKYDSVQRADS
ncbi:hypothetical protein BDV98DRAFT_547276 [Pterulicium gracile]|uniref:Tetraspanin Tsp2 n=1 Tax=Pterulicium gracile TaxID=1884261 RepID=A0A5C3QWH2_9AGAR|nr:hypothetical protein BDV98DRAFT_547276 [Pterula gracilis]